MKQQNCIEKVEITLHYITLTFYYIVNKILAHGIITATKMKKQK